MYTFSKISLAGLMALSQLASTAPTAVVEPVIAKLPAEEQVRIVPELIVELGSEYGVDTELALKIARCESNFQQFSERSGKLIRGRENAYDVGVFQINEIYHLAKSQELGFDIETAHGNIEYAVWLMKNEGIRHWIWSRPCWSK